MRILEKNAYTSDPFCIKGGKTFGLPSEGRTLIIKERAL